ncbi:patatin-like phospholipase family protein [Klenkia brasiliensis]|uniref:NTE family protein n=1 Tax=Klenkia brasiliensis TaxID=333142 RepID=A0A1G8ABP0_9ACTN|nr:patatin-like phospholipase family protein [Klenkia brasiliensis]SDH18283.1 NTE family protein [Klenkia brasiliensis]
MTDPTTPDRPRVALVLGAGGVAGIAWETGLLAGLADAGLDLVARADLLVGTSAGATVAAQIASGTPVTALHAAQVEGTGAPEPQLDVDLAAIGAAIGAAMAEAPDAQTGRRRVGALATETDRVPEAERRSLIASRLADHEWPERGLQLTAVSTSTGELAVFTRDSGVDLVDAVAASCAIPLVWPAVTIGDDRYMDGGLRTPTNADLAADQDVVVVLDAYGAGVAELSSVQDGVQVVVIAPDEASRATMANLLDPASRTHAAKAGHLQAQAELARVQSAGLASR